MASEKAMMALKMLYRGPSSRLENLIEKIQATKEIVNAGNYDFYIIFNGVEGITVNFCRDNS